MFAFAATRTQFVRFVASDSPQPNPGDYQAAAIGEVAFRVAAKPVANDDSFTSPDGDPVDGNVLDNDTPDDGTLTAVPVSGPGDGMLSLNNDGTFTYTPDDDFEGLDSFTYKAYDGTNYSDVATVTIAVGDTSPDPVDSASGGGGGGGPCPTPAQSSPVVPDALQTDLSTAPAESFVAPVRYDDGVVDLETTDLESDGFGAPFTQSRSWTNGAGYAAVEDNGTGMVDIDQPYLLQVSGNNTVAAVTSGTDALYFDLTGGAYAERFGGHETLAQNSSTGEFVLTDTSGDVLRFYGFGSSVPFDQRGQLASITDPAGDVTDLSARNAAGQVSEVVRSNTTGATTVTEAFFYTYIMSGVNKGLLNTVTLERETNGGSFAPVRSVVYAYYDGTESYGNAGDLQTATIEDASGNPIDVDYYRYYTPGEANGYTGGLQYYFSPAAYARLATAVGDPTTATDAQVALFADNAFQYDSQHRVTEEVAQGLGCSLCSGGLGTFTYGYTSSGNTPGFDSWSVRTVETLPDGSENIVYTNAFGEVMLNDYRDTTGQDWDDFYEYNSSGQVVLHASPSAVTRYDDTYADLLHQVTGNYQYLSDSSGLIDTTSYVTTGAGAGYASQTALEQGELGTAVPQETLTYTSQTAGGVTVVEIASDTVYSADGGMGKPRPPGYAYNWFPASSTRMQSKTITYPVVDSTENGPDSADVETYVYNNYGQVIWTKDGDGYLNYTAYDPSTEAPW